MKTIGYYKPHVGIENTMATVHIEIRMHNRAAIIERLLKGIQFVMSAVDISHAQGKTPADAMQDQITLDLKKEKKHA